MQWSLTAISVNIESLTYQCKYGFIKLSLTETWKYNVTYLWWMIISYLSIITSRGAVGEYLYLLSIVIERLISGHMIVRKGDCERWLWRETHLIQKYLPKISGICFANMRLFSVHIILGGTDGEDWHVPILRLLAAVCIKYFPKYFRTVLHFSTKNLK